MQHPQKKPYQTLTMEFSQNKVRVGAYTTQPSKWVLPCAVWCCSRTDSITP